MPYSIRALLESWQSQKVGKRKKKIWKSIPLCIMWPIWLGRNSRCFEDKSSHISVVKNRCLQNLYFRCSLYLSVPSWYLFQSILTYLIKNNCISKKVHASNIKDKIRGGHLRWYGHIQCRPADAPVPRCEAMVSEDVKGAR